VSLSPLPPDSPSQDGHYPARPELDTFLTTLPDSNSYRLSYEGRLFPYDMFANSTGLEHIQRLVLVNCSKALVDHLHDEVRRLLTKQSVPPGSSVMGLGRMKNLKRVLLVPNRKRGNYNISSRTWKVFHGLCLLPGEYSMPEIYCVPFGTRIIPHNHIEELSALPVLYQPEKGDLECWGPGPIFLSGES
jgi:hypothetical protein